MLFLFLPKSGGGGDRPSLAPVSYGPDKYVHLMPFTLLRFTNKTVNLVGATYIRGSAHHPGLRVRYTKGQQILE